MGGVNVNAPPLLLLVEVVALVLALFLLELEAIVTAPLLFPPEPEGNGISPARLLLLLAEAAADDADDGTYAGG